MKTRLLLPLLSLAALPLTSARADIFGFAAGTGYTINQGQAAAGASIANGVATLTSGATYQGNSVFYNTQQNVNAFNVSFTYRGVIGSTSNTIADGFTFTIQNDTRGLKAVGFDGGALGYVGGSGITLPLQTGQNAITPSVAVGFNIYNGSTTGMGTNGTLTLNNNTTALLNSGNPININLSYNGLTLTETLTDSTNAALTNTFSYSVNIANVVGNNGLAYVGFTGADGASTSTQTISNFQFNAVPEPSTWAAGALGLGLCAVAVRRRYRQGAEVLGSK